MDQENTHETPFSQALTRRMASNLYDRVEEDPRVKDKSPSGICSAVARRLNRAGRKPAVHAVKYFRRAQVAELLGIQI